MQLPEVGFGMHGHFDPFTAWIWPGLAAFLRFATA